MTIAAVSSREIGSIYNVSFAEVYNTLTVQYLCLVRVAGAGWLVETYAPRC